MDGGALAMALVYCLGSIVGGRRITTLGSEGGDNDGANDGCGVG